MISWYLNEIESQIENEEQLNEQSALIEKILNRLINYVSLVKIIEPLYSILIFYYQLNNFERTMSL